MKKPINSSGNPKMQILENKLRKMIREELLKEARYEDPGLPDTTNADNMGGAFKAWLHYQGQFSNIVRLLTDRSGSWYVGVSQTELANKIKSMDPARLKEFRSEVAALLQKSRIAQKAMGEVQQEANRLIQSLG